MQTKIKEEAKKLYESVLEKFVNRDKFDRRSFGEILDSSLDEFNKSIKKLLRENVYKILKENFGKDLPEVMPTLTNLSDRLYRNAKIVAKRVLELFKTKDKSKTMQEVARKLYDGYGFKDKEILEIKKELPKYLKEHLKSPKNQKRILKQIKKLKTKPLKIAYSQLAEIARSEDKKAIEKALRVALEERARYYANRVAQTEQQRAINLARAKEYLEDDEIKFVRYRLSAKHKIVDICDYHSKLNIGYGAGIIPKKEMIILPLHPHCYDKDTEVYTNNGWKFFKDLKGEEQFLSFNPKNRKIEFVKAKNFVCWYNSNKMISFKHKHFDLLVTDKHRMAIYKRVMRNGLRVEEFKFVEAKECINKEYKIPRSAIWCGNNKNIIKIDEFEFDTMAFCEFMGYYLSDGSVNKRKYNYQITIAQESSQERIFKVIKRLGFNPYYAKGYIGFSGDFGKYLMQFGKAKDKFIPNKIKKLDIKYLWKFLEAFVSCDGNIRPEKDFKGYKSKPEYVFYTSSKRLADDLGELILKCGYQPSFYLQKSKGKEVEFKNGKYTINEDIWIIRLKRSKNANISNLEIKEVGYNGLVYCVELEKYNILWVRRNGKTCFSGNCMCRYEPYYREPKHKKIDEPEKKTLESFNKYEQKQILGSWENWRKFKQGEMEIVDIFNLSRPKFPIKKYTELELFKNIEKSNNKNIKKSKTLKEPQKSQEASKVEIAKPKDIQLMLNEVKEKKRLTKNKLIVGVLGAEIIEFLKSKDVDIYSKEIYLTAEKLSHFTRGIKKSRGAELNEEDILRIPEILEKPLYIFFDTLKKHRNLIYIFKSDKIYKIVVQLDKKKKFLLIVTAGREELNKLLKDKQFILIFKK